jgi:RHS repeat-associated protein
MYGWLSKKEAGKYDIPRHLSGHIALLLDSDTCYAGCMKEYKLVIARKYYDAGGSRVAMREAGTLYWLLTDHLGSTSKAANSDGSFNSEQMYKPFGEKRYPTGSPTLPTTYRYTGQRSETGLGPSGGEGLMFYGARWYDSQLGRFLSADSIIPGAGNPQAWDRYAGMSNNPVKYNDPTGHSVDDTSNPDSDDPPITYDDENGLCINTFNIGCIGGTSYNEWWSNEHIPALLDYIVPEGIIFGVSLNGNAPANANTIGVEALYLEDGSTTTFNYIGEGNTVFGLGANASAYWGGVYNIDSPEKYIGPFASIGATISLGEVGITLSYFWDSSSAPLTPGTIQGFTIGYAPGANVSAWYSNTYYQLLTTNP